MRPDEIRPAIGQRYRHRQSGRVAILMRYRLDRGCSEDFGSVELTGDDGWTWSSSVGDFWAEWIHADAFDERRN